MCSLYFNVNTHVIDWFVIVLRDSRLHLIWSRERSRVLWRRSVMKHQLRRHLDSVHCQSPQTRPSSSCLESISKYVYYCCFCWWSVAIRGIVLLVGKMW